MWKTDRARLDDILQYLANLNLGGDMPDVGRNRVSQFADDFIQRRYPHRRLRYNSRMHQFSQAMSLGSPYVGPETQPDRMQRRAVYLLWAAIYDAANVAGQQPPGLRSFTDPRQKLVDTMWKAWLIWGQNNNDHTPHRRLLGRIRRNPRKFLRTNGIRISGSSVQAEDPVTHAATDQNIQGFNLFYEVNSDLYEIMPGSTRPNSYPFNATSVKAEHWTQVPGRGANTNIGSFAAIHGTELGGTDLGGVNIDIMLTTQFTGCSFCIKQHAGHVYAAHIAPRIQGVPGSLDGDVLARQLCGLVPNVTAGNFANAPGVGPFHVYGREHSNIPGHQNGYPRNVRMYIIGFIRLGEWRIYSQHYAIGQQEPFERTRIF